MIPFVLSRTLSLSRRRVFQNTFSGEQLRKLSYFSGAYSKTLIQNHNNKLIRDFRKFCTSNPSEVKDEPIETTATDIETIPKNNEKVTGTSQKHEFQAETKKLLDIVAKSLYTEREVFLRELVSNSSDALEKLRHQQVSNQSVSDPDLPLEINIFSDTKSNLLIIQDHGVGMTKEELVQNLGSIGHSGSLDFLKNVAKGDSASNIIGQFGVGFYSVFMVSHKVEVFSKSFHPDSKGYYWVSDGSGSYEISDAEEVLRGTKIVIHLSDNAKEFSLQERIEGIIKKYSNFVGFPIKVNGNSVNTVKPLWTMSKEEITEDQHKEFYQFIAHAFDEPFYKLYFSADSPINIRGLFYVGKQHSEKFGLGRMEPGINLFSRKVLIQPKAKGLLPDWFRFIKGVVDSEDISLNISREHLQDSALIQRIGSVLTKRMLKWLDDESKKDGERYNQFFREFGNFLKEGACTDYNYRQDIAKLLRYESSKTKEGELTSLDDYISRMGKEHEQIYFLVVPNRNLAESSPYFESFKKEDKEVLFLYSDMDDFVMSHLIEYKKFKLESIEQVEPTKPEETEMSQDVKPMIEWLKDVLHERVSSIEITKRLVDTPAVISDPESASFRRMMKFIDPQRAGSSANMKQKLLINPDHNIMKGMFALRENNPELAQIVAQQIFDNALVAAGLMDDARSMIPRLTDLMSKLISKVDQPNSTIEKQPKD